MNLEDLVDVQPTTKKIRNAAKRGNIKQTTKTVSKQKNHCQVDDHAPEPDRSGGVSNDEITVDPASVGME